jgi:hypothetical protein
MEGMYGRRRPTRQACRKVVHEGSSGMACRPAPPTERDAACRLPLAACRLPLAACRLPAYMSVSMCVRVAERPKSMILMSGICHHSRPSHTLPPEKCATARLKPPHLISAPASARHATGGTTSKAAYCPGAPKCTAPTRLVSAQPQDWGCDHVSET